MTAAGIEANAVVLSEATDRIDSMPFFTSEQWSTLKTLVVPVFGSIQVEAMLCRVIKMLQYTAKVAHKWALPATSPRRPSIQVLFVTAGNEGPALDAGYMGCGAVWGLARAGRIELGNRVLLTCLDTDAPVDLGDNDLKQMVSQILDELGTHVAEQEVVYRGGVRHVRRLKQYLHEMQTPTQLNCWVPKQAHLTAIITGGLGGLGVVTAEALVDAGARYVVLASRSGKIKYLDQGLDERLEALKKASGARIVLAHCDTSIEAEVEGMLEHVRATYGPLHLLVHAAGVLSDGLLPAQDVTSMRRVWGPKADGAWFLHKHSKGKDQELGAFIMYSSVASLFGNAGQANYSAANAYLDELARWRVDQGLPGVSIQWPAVSGVGMAAAMEQAVQINDKLSVNATMVKRVVKQVMSGVKTSSLAIVPRTMLMTNALPASMHPLVESVKVGSDESGTNTIRHSRRQPQSGTKKANQLVEKVDRLPIYPSPIDDLLICFQPGDSASIAPIVICIGLLGWIQGRGFMKLFPPSQPIYAMQAPELTSNDDGNSFTIKERAWEFYQVLRRQFSTTGVHLFGGSFGGPLSAEIALFFQNANIPFTLMMHDPLPATALSLPTDVVARRALDYTFLFGVLSRTKQLTDRTRKTVTTVDQAWFDETAATSRSVAELDHAVKQLLSVDDVVFGGLMKTMSVMAKARESLNTFDPKETIHASVTIFTMSEGGVFFADFFGYPPESCLASTGYGWSTCVADANIVELHGGHLEGLGNEDAMAAVGQHIQNVVSAEPLQYRPLQVHKSMDTIVTHIELLSDVITDHMVDEIVSALEPGRLHVFASACSDFCVGRPARVGFETEYFDDGIEGSARLLRELDSQCDMPIITLCHGAMRGVGAVFAAVSDLVLATTDATFVLSEFGAGQGGIMGIGAIALARRLDERHCCQLVQAGAVLEAEAALKCGLVDSVCTTRAAARQELDSVIQVVMKTPVKTLRARKLISRSSGNPCVALVETGKSMMMSTLGRTLNDPGSGSAVRTQWHADGVAVMELLSEEGEACEVQRFPFIVVK